MAFGMESEKVNTKKYTFVGTGQNKISFPIEFVPHTVIFYDHYPNDYYLENGSINFETNSYAPIYIYDFGSDYAFKFSPYSTNSGNAGYDARNCVSYEDGILTLNPGSFYKSFGTHKYTIIVIGEIEEEILEV